MSNKLTKKDVISNIYNTLQLPRKDIECIVDSFIEQIVLSLEQEKSVKLRGFGTFLVRKRKSRNNAHNPQQPGKKIQIEEHNAVMFRSGKSFRERVWTIKG